MTMTATLSVDGTRVRDALVPLPLPSPAVRRRMLATAHAIGALVDFEPERGDPRLKGCLTLPLAGIMLAGTACSRPMLFAESDALARTTALDVLVLRHDALRGTTFDIKLHTMTGWLRRYLARPVADGLRLVSDLGNGPIVHVSADGLELEADPLPIAVAGTRRASLLVEA